MITIKHLIKVAPITEEVRSQLLAKADSLSPEKKYEIEEMCWAFISTDYQNRLQFELQKATLEMAKGEKTYSKEDFQKIEDDLFADLAKRLEAAESQEDLAEVREKLQTHTNNPSPQSPQQP